MCAAVTMIVVAILLVAYIEYVLVTELAGAPEGAPAARRALLRVVVGGGGASGPRRFGLGQPQPQSKSSSSRVRASSTRLAERIARTRTRTARTGAGSRPRPDSHARDPTPPARAGLEIIQPQPLPDLRSEKLKEVEYSDAIGAEHPWLRVKAHGVVQHEDYEDAEHRGPMPAAGGAFPAVEAAMSVLGGGVFGADTGNDTGGDTGSADTEPKAPSPTSPASPEEDSVGEAAGKTAGGAAGEVSEEAAGEAAGAASSDEDESRSLCVVIFGTLTAADKTAASNARVLGEVAKASRAARVSYHFVGGKASHKYICLPDCLLIVYQSTRSHSPQCTSVAVHTRRIDTGPLT